MKKMLEWLKSFHNVILALTALLVVVPSLINAGIDVYRNIRNIPKTAKEQQNAELFQRHFQEAPVYTAPLLIKQTNKNLQLNIDVYGNGDIFVRYGENGQWFPFVYKEASNNMLLVQQAFAQTTSIQGKGKYHQNNREEGKYVIQERIYENNVKEVITFDKNTGDVVSRKTSTISPTSKSMSNPVKQSEPIVIDIDALKK
jgi:hypothetical protein